MLITRAHGFVDVEGIVFRMRLTVFLHGLVLLLDVLWHLIIDVRKHQLWVRLQTLLCFTEGLQNLEVKKV